MDRGLALFGIGLLFGAAAGFVFAAGQGITLDGHDHSTGHGAHSATTDLGGGPDAPALAAQLTKDPEAGWLLHLDAANFSFAPERAGQAAVTGEGHAHLYRNGTKIARLYGPWYHVEAEPGDRLRVALYGNDHSALAVSGVPVAVEIEVPR